MPLNDQEFNQELNGNNLQVQSIDNVDYNCGDKRSYGDLQVQATLSDGSVLTFSGMIPSSGGLEDLNISINGEPVALGDEDFEIEVPHYYAGHRTCGKWEDRKIESLTDDINYWLKNRSLNSL